MASAVVVDEYPCPGSTVDSGVSDVPTGQGRSRLSRQHWVDDSASGCSLRIAGRRLLPFAARVTSAELQRRRHLAEIAHSACASISPHLAPKSGNGHNVTEVSPCWYGWRSCRQALGTGGPVHCVAQWLRRRSHLPRGRDLAELARLVASFLVCGCEVRALVTEQMVFGHQQTPSSLRSPNGFRANNRHLLHFGPTSVVSSVSSFLQALFVCRARWSSLCFPERWSLFL